MIASPRLFRFDDAEADIYSQGILQSAIRAAFLGTAPPPPPIMPGPSWARGYIAREHAASEITYAAVAAGRMRCPGPWTNTPAIETYAFVLPEWSQHLFHTVPVVKAFEDGGREFFLVFSGLNARPTHLIIPSLECVFHEFDKATAAPLYDMVTSHIAGAGADLRTRYFAGTVCIVDMVNNCGHQMIHHLSGVQRLVDSGLAFHVDEVWICGVEFFDRVEKVFPELASRIRRMHRSEVAGRLETTSLRPVKLGSNIFQASLRSRLRQDLAPTRSSPAPRVVFTIRSQGRACRNLPTVIEQVVAGLLPEFPDLRIVLDGWVQADSQITCDSDLFSAVSGSFHSMIKADCDLCVQIVSRLPAGVVDRILVGRSMSASLAGIADAHCYVAHIGTLQHKLAFLSETRGIMHGPTAELRRMEVGPYSAEAGQPPILLSADCVRDIPSDTTRGPGFFDYEITDAASIVQCLRAILHEAG